MTEQALVPCPDCKESGRHLGMCNNWGQVPATWRRKILSEMEENGDSFDRLVAVVPDEAALDCGFWDFGPAPPSFTLWTEEFVYFGDEFDSMYDVVVVPRNPRAEPVRW